MSVLLNNTTYHPVNSTFDSMDCVTIRKLLPDPVDKMWIQLNFGLIYLIVWLLAVAGNLGVIYVAALCKDVSFTVRTVFILSLACSDLLISITSLPITAITIFVREWIFPTIFCKIIGTVQGSSIFVSSFTLTAIAIDRYYMIVHPISGPKVSYGRASIIVIIIWILGYLLASPMFIFSDVSSYNGVCGYFCEEKWPGQGLQGTALGRKIYGLSVLCVQFGLPVFLCSFCYISISKTLAIQMRRRLENQTLLPESERRLIYRRKRTNRMMVAMVISFVMAWLLLNIVNIVRDFNLYVYVIPVKYFSLAFAAAHVIAMTVAIWNPIIYCLFNEQFRMALKRFCPQLISDRFSRARDTTSSPRINVALTTTNLNGKDINQSDKLNGHPSPKQETL